MKINFFWKNPILLVIILSLATALLLYFSVLRHIEFPSPVIVVNLIYSIFLILIYFRFRDKGYSFFILLGVIFSCSSFLIVAILPALSHTFFFSWLIHLLVLFKVLAILFWIISVIYILKDLVGQLK